MNGLYYVATNLNLGSQLSPFQERKAAELLMMAETRLNTIQFNIMKLDKLRSGMSVMCMLMQKQPMPSDGYLWQDQESITRLPILQGRDLEILSWEQGFVPGDQHVSMTKKLYRLTGGQINLMLLHYLAVPSSAPRIPVLPQSQQMAAAMLAQHHASPPPAPAAQTAASKPRHRKSSTVPPTAQQASPAEESIQVSGDELDHLTVRDISMLRYKRNHDLIAEVLSPLSVSDLIYSHKEIFQTDQRQQRADKARRLLAEDEAHMLQLKQKHRHQLQSMQSQRALVNQLQAKALSATNQEELDRIQEEFCRPFHARIQPIEAVRAVKIE